jgi:hypothetical protein
MPIDAFLRIGEEFEAMADHDPTPLIQADLRDGSKLRAGNVKELRQELATESASDIVRIAVGFGMTTKAQTWLTWDKEPGELRLLSEGQDEAKVHGIYGPVMRRIENRLEAIDRGDTESQGPLKGADPTARSVVTVGSITAGNVAVSGSGPATSASLPSKTPEAPTSHWWQQAWVTVGAPIVVLVVAGIILALVLGH